MDLGILLDVAPKSQIDIDNVKDFTQLIVKGFNTLLSTHVGLVTTEFKGNSKLRFRGRNPLEVISSTLEKWRLNQGRRNLSDVLKTSLTKLFYRGTVSRSVPRVLLLITDRLIKVNEEKREILLALKQLENTGVNVFVVGATSDVKRKWVHQLAIKPNIHMSKTYGELGLHSSKITSSICKIGGKINRNQI